MILGMKIPFGLKNNPKGIFLYILIANCAYYNRSPYFMFFFKFKYWTLDRNSLIYSRQTILFLPNDFALISAFSAVAKLPPTPALKMILSSFFTEGK